MSIRAARNTRGEEAMAQKKGLANHKFPRPELFGSRGRRARARGHSLVGEERSSHVDGLDVAHGSRIGIGSSDRACSGAVPRCVEAPATRAYIGDALVGFGLRHLCGVVFAANWPLTTQF